MGSLNRGDLVVIIEVSPRDYHFNRRFYYENRIYVVRSAHVSTSSHSEYASGTFTRYEEQHLSFANIEFAQVKIMRVYV